jgi:hypothetical protein
MCRAPAAVMAMAATRTTISIHTRTPDREGEECQDQQAKTGLKTGQDSKKHARKHGRAPWRMVAGAAAQPAVTDQPGNVPHSERQTPRVHPVFSSRSAPRLNSPPSPARCADCGRYDASAAIDGCEEFVAGPNSPKRGAGSFPQPECPRRWRCPTRKPVPQELL